MILLLLLMALTANSPFSKAQTVTGPTQATGQTAKSESLRPVPRTKPNVLLFIVDDMGLEAVPNDKWGAAHLRMGMSASVNYPDMRVLKKWAGEGVYFDNVWTNPRCSPTRSAILSGRYGFRTGMGDIARDDKLSDITKPESAEFAFLHPENSLADIANLSNYQTLMVGKWHLHLWDATQNIEPGAGFKAVTSKVGFDVASGMLGNLNMRAGNAAGPNGNLIIDPPPLPDPGPAPLFGQGYWYGTEYDSRRLVNPEKSVTFRDKFAVELLYDKFKDWLDNTRTRGPWFCWFAQHATHGPFGNKFFTSAGASGLDPITQGSTSTIFPPYTTYGQAVLDANSWTSFRAGAESVDSQMAQIETDLTAAGLLDETIIIVLGDNGAPNGVYGNMCPSEGAEITAPYSDGLGGIPLDDRMKGSVYQGGIVNWMIVRGPAAFVGNTDRLITTPVDVVDVFTTIREWTRSGHVTQRTTDGISFANIVRSNTETAKRTFHYSERFSPNGNPRLLTNGGVTPQRTFYSFSPEVHMWDRAYSEDSGGTTFKLIDFIDGSEEFYDLDADPYETTPLALSGAAYTQLRASLDALLATESP